MTVSFRDDDEMAGGCRYNVLGMSDGINEWGELRWQNVACLAASWSLTLVCLFKGIRTSGIFQQRHQFSRNKFNHISACFVGKVGV